MIRLVCSIQIVLAASFPAVARGDDVRNAGFEEGTKDWSLHVFGPEPQVKPDADIRHGGDRHQWL